MGGGGGGGGFIGDFINNTVGSVTDAVSNTVSSAGDFVTNTATSAANVVNDALKDPVLGTVGQIAAGVVGGPAAAAAYGAVRTKVSGGSLEDALVSGATGYALGSLTSGGISPFPDLEGGGTPDILGIGAPSTNYAPVETATPTPVTAPEVSPVSTPQSAYAPSDVGITGTSTSLTDKLASAVGEIPKAIGSVTEAISPFPSIQGGGAPDIYGVGLPTSTLGQVALAAAGLGIASGMEPVKVEQPIQAQTASGKTYTYGVAPPVRRSGLQELYSAASNIYGNQPVTTPALPPAQVFQQPSIQDAIQPSIQERIAAPLLAQQAPAGLAAIAPKFQSLEKPQAVNLATLIQQAKEAGV